MNDAEMLERVAVEVRGFVERKFAPMTGEITRLRDVIEQQAETHAREVESLKRCIADLQLKQGPAGKDGKDAPPADVEAIVSKVLEKIPEPKNGVDGKDAPAVDIDAIIPKVLERIPTPKDGKDAPAVDTGAIVSQVLAMVPVPKDGKDAPPVDTGSIVSQVMALIPKPRDGEKGDKGNDGKDGSTPDLDLVAAKVLGMLPPTRDGKDGRDAPAVDVGALVTQVMSLIPPPRDGLKGDKGDKGESGRDGVDGNGIKRIEHDTSNHKLALFMDNGDVFTLDLPKPERGEKGEKGERGLRGENGADGVDGKEYPPPKDGKDGADIDNFDAVIKDGRTLALSYTLSDGHIVTKELVLRGMVVDRGVYKQGTEHVHGDAVTYGGSYWIAQKDTRSPPGNGSSDWRLAVKRGRDGKDATEGDE